MFYFEPPYAYGEKEWVDYYLVLNEIIKRMKYLGINWIRWPFHISRIEPKPNQFRSFKETHKALAILRENNINVMGLLIEMPEWNAHNPEGFKDTGTPNYPPKDLSLFQNSIKVIVNEFKDEVKYWQIWEEPDVMLENWEEDNIRVKTYAKMLKVAHNTIKGIDTNLKIIVGSFHPPIHTYDVDWLGYVNKLTTELEKPEYGNKPIFDILAINAYHSPYHPKDKNPKTGMNLGEELGALKSEFEKSKLYRDKKMWVTLLSWPAIGNKDRPEKMMVSEENQAKYVEALSDVLFDKEYIEKVFWFDLADAPYRFEGVPEFEFYGGLMRYDKNTGEFIPKKSYEAFKKLVEKQEKIEKK
jgi:hypothetical protein